MSRTASVQGAGIIMRQDATPDMVGSALYFEVEMLPGSSTADISVGLAPSISKRVAPTGTGKEALRVGFGTGECGYRFNTGDVSGGGEVFTVKRFGPSIGIGDIVGCGVTCQGRIYFTRNGTLVGVMPGRLAAVGTELHPTLSASGRCHLSLRVAEPFAFGPGVSLEEAIDEFLLFPNPSTLRALGASESDRYLFSADSLSVAGVEWIAALLAMATNGGDAGRALLARVPPEALTTVRSKASQPFVAHCLRMIGSLAPRTLSPAVPAPSQAKSPRATVPTLGALKTSKSIAPLSTSPTRQDSPKTHFAPGRTARDLIASFNTVTQESQDLTRTHRRDTSPGRAEPTDNLSGHAQDPDEGPGDDSSVLLLEASDSLSQSGLRIAKEEPTPAALPPEISSMLAQHTTAITAMQRQLAEQMERMTLLLMRQEAATAAAGAAPGAVPAPTNPIDVPGSVDVGHEA